MRVCPTCGSRFVGTVQRCPIDGGALREEADPLVGGVVAGRYRILARIAEGGMATVYRARQDPLDRIVAVKILSAELSADPSHKERFLREARAANRIHHDCVVDVTDFGEVEDGRVFLVMEFLEGESLADRVSRGPMSIPEAIGILRDVCRGLGRAHELGILHRDLKPENIHLQRTSDGAERVKILDFGLAQLLGDKRLTSAGQVFGTPEYLSPEQAMGREATPASDLYALGVVFFEMVTGELPFSGSAARLIYLHINELPRPPSSVRPGLLPEADELILRLLAKKPADRLASARELLDALETLETRVCQHDRMATASTVRSSTMELIDFPADGLESLGRRVESCRQTWMRARERPDPEDGRAVTAASDKLSELERQRQTMVQVAREYRDFVQHGRATLLRMRKAATELARDEARLQGEINGLQETLSRTRAARDEAAAAFDRVRGEVAAGDPAAPLDAHAALAWESAGKAARRWRETVTEAEAAERDVAVRTEEHEEVRFQLGQFRGRIAAYEVDLADDGDFAGEAGAYRKRMTEAHRRFIAAVDETARMVDQLCKRFGLS